MERTLTKTPHKDRVAPQSKSAASIPKKAAVATTAPRNPSKAPTRHVRAERTSASATAQAVKKLAQMSTGHTDRPERVRGASRSVNYLSSTAASRAKAASAAQIHKPATSVSVNKLLTQSQVKSEATLRSTRRPRSVNNNNNNMIKDSMDDSSNKRFKGKSRSQATLKPVSGSIAGSIRRKSVASAEVLRSKSLKKASGQSEDNSPRKKDEGQKSPMEKSRSNSAAILGTRKATSSLSTTLSRKPSKRDSRSKSSKSGRFIRVTMNRTSELRAALHRPSSGKRSGAKSESGSKAPKKSYRPGTTVTRDSKSKRRPRKRSSSESANSNKPSLAETKAKNLTDELINEAEREAAFRV